MVEFIAFNAPHNIFVTLNKVRDAGRKRIYVVNAHAVLWKIAKNWQKNPLALFLRMNPKFLKRTLSVSCGIFDENASHPFLNLVYEI